MAQSKITAEVRTVRFEAVETDKQEWHVQLYVYDLDDYVSLGTWIGTAGQIKFRFGQMERWSDPTNEKKTWGKKAAPVENTRTPVDLPVMEGVLTDA